TSRAPPAPSVKARSRCPAGLLVRQTSHWISQRRYRRKRRSLVATWLSARLANRPVMPTMERFGGRSGVYRTVLAVVAGLVRGSVAALLTFVAALAVVPAMSCPRRCEGLS